VPVSAIVLAAGLSTRYGGRNKRLQAWGDTTVVGQVAKTLLACGLKVVVVTGRDAPEVAQATEPASTAFNPRFEEGLGSSIGCGVQAVASGNGILIALGDMPGLDPKTVRKLVEAFEEAGDDAILAPVYACEADRPGHPVLFGPAHRGALARLRGDEGAKSVIQTNIDKLRLIHVEGRLDDLDFPS